jgi:hypothetical protein
MISILKNGEQKKKFCISFDTSYKIKFYSFKKSFLKNSTTLQGRLATKFTRGTIKKHLLGRLFYMNDSALYLYNLPYLLLSPLSQLILSSFKLVSTTPAYKYTLLTEIQHTASIQKGMKFSTYLHMHQYKLKIEKLYLSNYLPLSLLVQQPTALVSSSL